MDGDSVVDLSIRYVEFFQSFSVLISWRFVILHRDVLFFFWEESGRLRANKIEYNRTGKKRAYSSRRNVPLFPRRSFLSSRAMCFLQGYKKKKTRGNVQW